MVRLRRTEDYNGNVAGEFIEVDTGEPVSEILEKQRNRQEAIRKAKEALYKIIDEHGLSEAEADMVLIDVGAYCYKSATNLLKTAVLAQDMGLDPEAAMQKLREFKKLVEEEPRLVDDYYRNPRE